MNKRVYESACPAASGSLPEAFDRLPPKASAVAQVLETRRFINSKPGVLKKWLVLQSFDYMIFCNIPGYEITAI
jgi:hypothetical protein